MFILGLIVASIGIALTYTFHYYQDVRNTNDHGVIEVDGFGGYIWRVVVRFIVSIILLVIILTGLGMIVVGIWGMLP